MSCPEPVVTWPLGESNPARLESWRKVRFGYIRRLRKCTKWIILYMAYSEVLQRGAAEIAMAGSLGFPAPDPTKDYGFAYTVARILAYVYICVFVVIYDRLFKWWLPFADSPVPPKLKTTTEWLVQASLVIICLSIIIRVVFYLINLLRVFIYVEARPAGSFRLPKNGRKIWAVRGLLVASIVLVFVLVSVVILPVLEANELARVKNLEYYLILCPIQINVGLLVGSKFQARMEREMVSRERARKAAQDNEARQLEMGSIGKKLATVETEVPSIKKQQPTL